MKDVQANVHKVRVGSRCQHLAWIMPFFTVLGREFPERSFLSLLSLQPCVFRDLRAPYAGLLPCASLDIISPFCSGKGIRSDRSGHSAVPWQRPLAAPPSPAAEATVVGAGVRGAPDGLAGDRASLAT
jgi:hypothetical protein